MAGDVAVIEAAATSEIADLRMKALESRVIFTSGHNWQLLGGFLNGSALLRFP
jgi:hypothetical protein